MSEKTVTIWTCDRCDAKAETGHGEQPTRWAGVRVVHPPRAGRDLDRGRTVHLCGECDSDLVAFIDYPRPASGDPS